MKLLNKRKSVKTLRMHSKSLLYLLSLILILKCNANKSMNKSEIDSLISLHDRVKDTLVQMLINGKCDSPKATVFYINESKDKIYLPRATVVHRCSDQFSCCPNPKHSCQAVDEEEVDVGFYTLIRTEDDITERGIEIKKFLNHTKCGCVRNNGTFVEVISSTIDSNKRTMAETNDVSVKSINTTKILDMDIVSKTIKHTTDKNYTKSTFNISTTVLPETDLHISTKNTIVNREEINKNMSLETELPLNTINIFSKTTSKPLNITTEQISLKTTPLSILLNTTTFKSTNFLTTFMLKNITTVDLNKNPKPIQTTETHRNSFSTPKTWSSTTSTINYRELEREEDLNPQEDVVYSGVNFLYTKRIFVLPRITPSFRYPTARPDC